jgi:hypothetical protein
VSGTAPGPAPGSRDRASLRRQGLPVISAGCPGAAVTYRRESAAVAPRQNAVSHWSVLPPLCLPSREQGENRALRSL